MHNAECARSPLHVKDVFEAASTSHRVAQPRPRGVWPVHLQCWKRAQRYASRCSSQRSRQANCRGGMSAADVVVFGSDNHSQRASAPLRSHAIRDECPRCSPHLGTHAARGGMDDQTQLGLSPQSLGVDAASHPSKHAWAGETAGKASATALSSLDTRGPAVRASDQWHVASLLRQIERSESEFVRALLRAILYVLRVHELTHTPDRHAHPRIAGAVPPLLHAAADVSRAHFCPQPSAASQYGSSAQRLVAAPE